MHGKVSEPWWDDRPVAIVAGGPSLRGFDFERLRGAHVLAIKGSIFDIPWADAGFGLDMPRFEDWRDKLAAVPMRVYWACPEDYKKQIAPPENVTLIRRLPGEGVSTDPRRIFTGGTSGFGALQIALLKRAKRIVLFGYDYNGDYHPSRDFRHNDRHYERRRTQNRKNWEAWAKYFDLFKPCLKDVEIINTKPSAITTFEKMSIDDAIVHLHRV